MKLPYGISNFNSLVTQGYLYIDRSSYIAYLEGLGEKYIFFLRPRRFGKSLFVSMLSYYYDLNEKENFQELFGKYYIGKNPTPLANQYAVLRFEFSRINTTNLESTLKGFLSNTQKGVKRFIETYGLISPAESHEILNQDDPAEVLKSLLSAYESKNLKLYVLIDEYDHFANELMAFDLESFKNIVSRNGFVRKFYETLKTGTFEGIIDRMFVTGVTPITLDSFTSGFNIASNLTLKLELNAMMGFKEAEVRDIVQNGNQNIDEGLLADLRKWYNGYLFHWKAPDTIYNPDMVLYFAKEYLQSGKYPDQMLDVNIASDYSKIRNLFSLRNPTQNFEALTDLVQKPFVPVIISPQFSFEKDFSKDDFFSLLYYMGFITYYDRTPFLSMHIPNYVIRALYQEYFIHLLKEREGLSFTEDAVREAILQMAFYDNEKPFFGIIESILQELSNRDYQNFDEKYIKLLIFAVSMISNQYYYLKSEQESKSGYIDILFLEKKPYQIYHQYAIELKYLKKEESKLLENTQAKASKQLRSYIQNDPGLCKQKNLKAFTMIVVKDKIYMEAVEF